MKYRLSMCMAALAAMLSPVHAAQLKLAAATAPVGDAVYGAFLPLMLGIGF